MGGSFLRLAVIALVAVAFFLPSVPALSASHTFRGYTGTFTAADTPLVTPKIGFFDAKGTKHTLLDHRGRVVLVNFWATWCPTCIAEMPSLDRLQAKLGGKDFEVLTISQDTTGVASVRKFLKRWKLGNLPLFIDRKRLLGMAFSQSLLPTSIILDRQGREVGRLIGGAEWDTPAAYAFIRRYIN